MTIQELDKKYNFHDSCITNIEYSRPTETLDILMDFCYWDQEWYKNGDPELMELKLIFEGVDNYDGPVGKVDYFGILNAEMREDEYFMLLSDDINEEYYEIHLNPSNAEVEIIRMFSEDEE